MKKTFILLSFVQTQLVLAIIPEDGVGGKIHAGTIELSDIPIFILTLIDLATKLAGSLAVIMLIYGGFQLIASGVTENKEDAKKTINYAIMGLFVAFSAWIIVDLIIVNLTK